MIVTAGQVRRAVEQQLRDGLPDLLAAMAPVEGVLLPEIVTWQRLPDFTLLAETQSPACVVTTPGIVGTPEQGPGRQPVTRWAVRVFFVVRGRTFTETADRVAAYTAAARSVLLGARRLPGLSSSVEWTAEQYAELASGADAAGSARTVGAGSVTVTYLGVQTDTAL